MIKTFQIIFCLFQASSQKLTKGWTDEKEVYQRNPVWSVTTGHYMLLTDKRMKYTKIGCGYGATSRNPDGNTHVYAVCRLAPW